MTAPKTPNPRSTRPRPAKTPPRLSLRSRRNWLDRDHVVPFLKSLAWVAPLSVLIWIYAEGERTDSQQQSVPFQVLPPDGQTIARVMDPPDRRLVATLRGTRSRLERIQQELTPSGTESRVVIPLDAGYGPGDHNLQSQLINNSPIFRENGVTVTSVSPPTFKVRVDRLASITVEVRTPSQVDNLTGPAAYSPRQVTITGPESLLDSFGDRVTATADLTLFDAIRTPGTHELSKVPIVLPPELVGENSVIVDPSFVQASVEVSAAEAEFAIPSVSVLNLIPQNLEKDYQVSVSPQTLARVPVVGPTEVIERMQRPDFTPQPFATVRINAADAGQGSLTRMVDFVFPEGVRLKADFARPQVTITLTPVER